MQDVHGQVILILRKFGMTRLGSRGRAILVDMAVSYIQDPGRTYQQILKEMEGQSIDIKGKKKYLANDIKGLSDLECCVLQAIEALEIEENPKNGRDVIKSWIMKIYDEYQQNLSYEHVCEEVMKLGFQKRKKGTDLLISFVYKRYIDPSFTKEELESYIIEQIDPNTIEEWEKENLSIPLEIMNGIEKHQAVLAKDQMIIEKIKSLIMEAAKDSLECSKLSSAEEVFQVVLNRI